MSAGQKIQVILLAAINEPVHQAAFMYRKRGRIVLVGVTGLELSRADFYEKELTFQVSCSYGSGRYDPNYEEKGQDYPIGFVRWTEQRNFEAVLDMLADGRLAVKPLISHRFPIEAAETAVLIPAFRAAGARLRSIASSGGVSGVHAGRKYGFEETTTDTVRLFAEEETNAVVITTRHDSHARFVLQALAAGKHVFVEKPLCLTLKELEAIEAAYGEAGPLTVTLPREGRPLLMVGFNRRFAPQVQKIKALLAEVPGPKSFIMTVNAGAIPADHWTQDPAVGGGRILGEACHFIDLLRYKAGPRRFRWRKSLR